MGGVTDFTRSILGHVGKPVTWLVPQIVESLPEVAGISLVTYKPAPVLSDRLGNKLNPAPEVQNCADSLHESYGIGFWDAVLAISMKQGNVSPEFVDLAVLHDAAPDEHETSLSRKEVTCENLEAIVHSAPRDYGVAMSSCLVLYNGTRAHLPMLDFHCTHSEEMVGVLKRALRAMGQRRGVLVQSPRSYHYYGLQLVTRDLLIDFLARALLFAPIADPRYIAHRLIDGTCRLRLGAVEGRGAAPMIKDVLDGDNG